jgi:quinol monooxygenase YgiN
VELKTFAPKGGFLWRSEPPKLGLGDQFIWIAKYQSHAGKRDDLLAAVLTHANNVHNTEDETLSFLVLEGTEDDTSLVLFERYTSESYFEKVHKVSDSMQQLRANVCIITSKSECYMHLFGDADLRIADCTVPRGKGE